MIVVATYAREEREAFSAARFCARLAREGLMTPRQAEALERGLEDFDVQWLELSSEARWGPYSCRFAATDLLRLRDSDYVLGVGRGGHLYEARRLEGGVDVVPRYGP